MTTALRQFWAILRKDLIIDLRRKENLVAMFFFALLTLMIIYFSAGALQATRYRLTFRAVDLLTAEGWNQANIDRLRPLIGISFTTRGEFFRSAAEARGDSLSGSEKIALAQAARGSAIEDVAAGFLWVTFLLAGVLGLDKSFGQERENGCMDGLLLTPVSRGVLYLGKMASNALFLCGVLVLLLPLFSLIFGLNLWGVLAPLALVMAAGVLGFTALGTLLGGLVSTVRGKEVLLPVLLFPLMVPVLIGVVHLTSAIFAGESLSQHGDWIRLVAGFDVVFVVVSYLIFDFVTEA